MQTFFHITPPNRGLTNYVSAIIQIRCKLNSAPIQVVLEWSPWNTPSFLLWLVQHFVDEINLFTWLGANKPAGDSCFLLHFDALRYWCATLIAHQLLWENMEDPLSIFQESPLAGEPRERLLHIHSVNRYQLLTKYLDPSTSLWQINGCNI